MLPPQHAPSGESLTATPEHVTPSNDEMSSCQSCAAWQGSCLQPRFQSEQLQASKATSHSLPAACGLVNKNGSPSPLMGRQLCDWLGLAWLGLAICECKQTSHHAAACCRQLDISTGSSQPSISGHPAVIRSIAEPMHAGAGGAQTAATTCDDGVLRIWQGQPGSAESQVAFSNSIVYSSHIATRLCWLSQSCMHPYSDRPAWAARHTQA